MNLSKSNLHTHTIFSDGKNTLEEMIGKARELGFLSLGFSDHSETAFDPGYCMAEKRYCDYRQEVFRLQKEWEECFPIFCGIEKDYFSSVDPEEYDYVIGSVHYLFCKGDYYSLDHSLDWQRKFIENCGSGDPLELAKRYYDLLVEHAQRVPFQIQGHLDLIAKFGLYDQPDDRYRAIALEATDALLETVPYFEVNTGAISRGYRKDPYPAPFLLEHLCRKGARMILSSDCHSASALDCHFSESEALLKKIGFSSVWRRSAERFEEISLEDTTQTVNNDH